tara:strand:+ start:414 stop:713 length:300 start_codon:yes stop_codon:yes gene_type:complete
MTDMFDLLPPESGCERFDCAFCGVLQRGLAVYKLIGRQALPRKNLTYMWNWLLTSCKRQRANLARTVLDVAVGFAYCVLCVESVSDFTVAVADAAEGYR